MACPPRLPRGQFPLHMAVADSDKRGPRISSEAQAALLLRGSGGRGAESRRRGRDTGRGRGGAQAAPGDTNPSGEAARRILHALLRRTSLRDDIRDYRYFRRRLESVIPLRGREIERLFVGRLNPGLPKTSKHTVMRKKLPYSVP